MDILLEGFVLLMGVGLGLVFSWAALSGVLLVAFRRQA